MPQTLAPTIVVFVHGWSVTNTDTYGELPRRLRREASDAGLSLQLEDIFLGRYISFHDEVRLTDISRAFESAVQDQLGKVLKKGLRFVCITHSTGGPVVRDWWNHYYQHPQDQQNRRTCPMSHLIMLAPANYGSALAQIGKERIGRLKSWLADVEPGRGVLDWLELGSAESWDLNAEWITSDGSQISPDGVFPFVLTGQSIDRAVYDQLNKYTGELGSDGVVRTAAAHLAGTYIGLVQEPPRPDPDNPYQYIAEKLEVGKYQRAPETALRVIAGKSHSGEKIGIMRSVKDSADDKASQATLESILSCIKVQSVQDYKNLCQQFAEETDGVQKVELVEMVKHMLAQPTYFIHDRFSMLTFRLRDDKGYAITDFDLILTAGADADPNHLPNGFFVDRQQNKLNPEIVTFYFNRDVMKGADEVLDKKGGLLRAALPGADMLGFKLIARPDSGFVRYLPCEIRATRAMLESALHGNSTTLVDIRLRRIVNKEVFRTEPVSAPGKSVDFANIHPGSENVPT